jgi:ABC-type Fe3+ transport system substrate-binding protein
VYPTILKAKKKLNLTKLLRNYFSSKELIQIFTSNFYSKIFHNSEVFFELQTKKFPFVASAQVLECPYIT